MSGHKPRWNPPGGRVRTSVPFSVAESAAMLGVPVRAIFDLIDKGELRSFTSKGSRCLTRSSSDQLLKWREHLPQWLSEMATPKVPEQPAELTI
jgi:hypothetical protein